MPLLQAQCETNAWDASKGLAVHAVVIFFMSIGLLTSLAGVYRYCYLDGAAILKFVALVVVAKEIQCFSQEKMRKETCCTDYMMSASSLSGSSLTSDVFSSI